MDDQNQPNNQFGNQPKKEEQADVTSSAPVEAEPSTSSPLPPAAPAGPAAPGQAPVQTANQPAPSVPQAPVAPGMPTQPEEEKKLEMPPQPGLLEAPKKKSGMLMALIVVALVVVLAVVGFVVYKAMY